MVKVTNNPIKELENFLNGLLREIDTQMQETQKAIRDLVIEDGYSAVRMRIFDQVQQIKNKFQEYLKENNLELDNKKTVFYLKEQPTSKGVKIPKKIAHKLNLIGIYATEEEKKLADDATKYILDVLMRRRMMHSNEMLTNGEYYFEEFFSLNDLIYEKDLTSKRIKTIEGIEVVVAKGEGEEIVKAPLPYIFTRIVALNKEDAFYNESQINKILKTLFIGAKQNKDIQQQLKDQSIEIKAREQDGKLIFYGTKLEEGEVQGIITIDPKLTGIIITHIKNDLRTFARKYKIGAEVENTEDAKLDYLCRCGEFFSMLYQNGYEPIFIQSKSDENEQIQNDIDQLTIEDKGILRINLPFGINGDIEDINKEFIKGFNSKYQTFLNKAEFDLIMGYILMNNTFAREEYLAYRKDGLKLHETIETAQNTLSQSILNKGKPGEIRDSIGQVYDSINKTIDSVFAKRKKKIRRFLAERRNKSQEWADSLTEKEWARRYTMSRTEESSEEPLGLPQFDYKTISDCLGKTGPSEMVADILNKDKTRVIGSTVVREV